MAPSPRAHLDAVMSVKPADEGSVMSSMPAAITVSLLTRMLREAFEGPPGPWTHFTETGPGTGLFGTISDLTASQTSQAGGPGHTTIAGHVRHLIASLDLTTRGLRGESISRDRSHRWIVTVVDDVAWAAAQKGLWRGFESLRMAVETHTAWDEDSLGVAFGAIAQYAAASSAALYARVGGGIFNPSGRRPPSRQRGRTPRSGHGRSRKRRAGSR